MRATSARSTAAARSWLQRAPRVLVALLLGGCLGRSITIEYAAPYADWEVAFDVGLPAHVVAAKSGLTDEQDLVTLLKDAPRGNTDKPSTNAALKKVSDFWNTGFDAKSIPDDPAIYLSDGPYIVRDIVP